MTQSRLGSLVEATINILIGFVINFAMNLTILPLFGLHVTGTQAFHIGLIFTVVSIIRSYAVRRWFNQYIHRAAVRVTNEE